MNPDRLNFSYNWNNKIDCSYFTTIRIENAKKYQVGFRLRVFLEKKKNIVEHIKDVEIISIKKIKLSDINEYIAGLDTGYDVEETKKKFCKMYPTAKWDTKILYFMLLKTIKY